MSRKTNVNKVVNNEQVAPEVKTDGVAQIAEQVVPEAKTDEAAPTTGVTNPIKVLDDMITVIYDETTNLNVRLARIQLLIEAAIDETVLPLELCSDAELLRRIRLVWSKKAMAKKAGDTKAFIACEAEEANIKSYRRDVTSPTSTVNTETADPATLSQADLNKLIRNYQSRKCIAKKALEAAITDANAARIAQFKLEVDAWQTKVDEASKFRVNSKNGSSNSMSDKIAKTIASLQLLPETEETLKTISELKALL